jgi:CBS domain-containing protein
MNIGDICTREVVMADRGSSLQQAAALMREHHVGSVLVVAGSPGATQAVGILTDRDMVVDAVARGLDVAQTEIGRLTDGKLACVPATTSIDDAVATMKEQGVRRLLVASDSGELYGIVSLDDLLGALAHEVSDLAYAMRRGIERESGRRPPLPRVEPQAIRILQYPSA